MVREKKKRKVEDEEELDPEAKERKRLKSLAQINDILSETPVNGCFPLIPSKTVVKHHGKDILKKSQRKNRYLFSFSGLLAPISGGKIGELTDLGSKNPILYLDFPQGRMKLFGTIVYPKNRYLTLQFSRGGKNVTCEDCFDTMIVFADAYWVGKKEDNPDETRLDFPKELLEANQSEVDFQGGAGATATRNKNVQKAVMKSIDEESPPGSPVDNMETESSEGKLNTKDTINITPIRGKLNTKDTINITPIRQSARTSGRKFQFAEVSSGDNSPESAADMSGEENDEASKSSNPYSLDQDPDGILLSTRLKTEQAPLPAVSNSETKVSARGSLVQATISTLFKKVEEKNSVRVERKMGADKDSTKKTQRSSSKLKSLKPKVVEVEKAENISKSTQAEKSKDRKKKKTEAIEVEDDIEEFTSASEDVDESDEDWHS